MTDHVRRDEALRALDEIRARQEQVLTERVIPAWFWSATAALMVVFSIGVESRRPILIGITAPVFAIGIASTVLAVVFRSRAEIRAYYLGSAGGVAIAAFVLATVGIGLGTGFGLAAAGFRWPATAGCAAAGLACVIGGPILMRRLGRIMTGRAAQSLGGAHGG